MQLTVTCIVFAGLCAHAYAYSQTVSLSVKDMPLEKVFNEIKKQTGYSFAYFESDLAKAKKVSIQITNANLREVLQRIFNDQPLAYTIVDKVIVVKTKSEKKIVVNGDYNMPAPPIDITGKVMNEKGEPIIGATVTVKGTRTATATNTEGVFELKKVEATATLVITGTDVETQEASVAGRREIIFYVKGRTGILDQIQVVAYGTTSQRFSVGSVGSVKAEDIEKQPINNPILALQGRIPGVIITQANGIPGGAVSIRIQGQNSLVSGNNPLIVIDGVPFPSTSLPGISVTGAAMLGTPAGEAGLGNPLSNINPADIESIDVLKDADATAIYGSRAANGAVLITTKKGKAGRTKVDFNVQNGWGRVAKKLDLLNTQQYMEMRREAKRNDNAAILPTDYDLRGVWDTTRSTDWQKVMVGNTARITSGTLGISGGTAGTQYMVNGTFRRETLVFPGNFALRSGSLHFNLNSTSLNQRFRFQLTGTYSISKSEFPGLDLSSDLYRAPVSPAIFNADGSLNWAPDPSTGRQSTWLNPFSQLYKLFDNNSNSLLSNMILSYRIAKGLDIKSTFGFSKLQSDQFSGSLINSQRPENRPNFKRASEFASSVQGAWIIEPQITYKKQVGKGKFDVLIGATIQQNQNKGASYYGSDFASDNLMRNIKSAATVISTNSTDIAYKYNGVFGRVNYNFKDKYLVNFSARRDGSSRFGPKNKFHDFGAIGIGWIFSEEFFIKNNVPFLSFGKLRGTFGTTGSDQIPDYTALNLYSSFTGGVPYQGSGTGLSASIYNPYLQWETTKKLQVGMDLGFLHDRILVNINYVRNRSSNQLLPYSLPYITGAATVLRNFDALVQNSAWEFSLSSDNIKTKNFNWNLSFNISVPNNKLVSYPNLSSSPYASSFIVGKPISISKAYPYYGVNPLSGVYMVSDIHGNPTSIPNSVTDQTVIISKFPKFYGGLQNSIRFKGLQLDFLFQFTSQKAANSSSGIIYPGNFSSGDFAGFSNQPTFVLNRWQRPGDIVSVARFSSVAITGSSSGDRNISDASFLRLKNISLAYQFPQALMKLMHIQDLSAFINAQNLFTVSKYIGFDPETQSSFSVPPLRVITVGLKSTF